jgi:hypothetical protein
MHIKIHPIAVLVAALALGWPPAQAAAGASDSAPARAYSNASAYGNFLRPFSATSPWNSRPVNPVLDTFQIPKNQYFPLIGEGPLSTGVFEAKADDPPLTIYKDPGSKYIRDVDAEQDKESITIPRWPASAIPASGGDGHCDVVDTVTGIVHSFWQLRKQKDGRWTAVVYAWTRIDGDGWGNASHYYQGARASAAPPIGGLIRKHEVNDGKDHYEHVLAMSLPFNALSPDPAYVYPATSADQYAASLNSGKIPEGALMMLPKGFDVAQLDDARLRKVANTLKLYGAYVVDQNVGTPFAIYVENGSKYDLNNGKGWVQRNADDMQKISDALRMVKSASFVSGIGKPVVRPSEQNLLSMRGVWGGKANPDGVQYDTWLQALTFPASEKPVEVSDGNGRGISKVTWAKINAGDRVKLTSISTGGGAIRASVWSGKKPAADTGYLKDGESKEFTMPEGGWIVLYARSGGGNIPATVSGKLVKLN